MNKEIYEKVVEGLKNEFNRDDIDEKTRFVEDLQADSVRLLEIVMDVEEEFDIELDDEKLSELKNVEDVVNEIERAQGK
ncbi:acyl carrier protein [Finegoldia magna]|uniref:Acyl carrier protein n=2 Tax=Finegoldia magna TaxID=1260 RepID=A0A133MYI7_FINMA|nr:phosphopantetheine-binding protein [Finegoldia magna]EFK93855.1 putative acyl carrier protein [Finegoldia magna ACS-171-V-Col3]EFL54966.1 putative acyl carrier protein [Finegoldia magna BVS033A4]EXF26812.1 acyl carrier protein [Finegoldia magna ALB8]KXA09106.1 putative acyl carrier protein [Finegoldia magna]MBS6927109.1 acyl carrier protein [Finegoldia magna]